jgi:galactonate dehydratase
MLDLVSQSLGTSIDQLLAGRVRDQARACAVDWVHGATGNEQLADAARETIATGFTMLRVEAFAPQEPVDLDVAAERVRVIRSAVGDDVDLVVSAQQRLTPSEAEEFADALRSVEPLWLEDLVASWLTGPLGRVSERLHDPLAAGRGARPDVLRNIAQSSVVDHVIVEIGRVGGLIEARRIAALAEIYHVGVISTGSGGPVSFRDALQLAAVVPNLSVIEVPRGLTSVEGGMIAVGGSPAGHTSPSETEAGS